MVEHEADNFVVGSSILPMTTNYIMPRHFLMARNPALNRGMLVRIQPGHPYYWSGDRVVDCASLERKWASNGAPRVRIPFAPPNKERRKEMFTAVFWLVVGLTVGWNLPQPDFAKKIQQKVVDFFKNLV